MKTKYLIKISIALLTFIICACTDDFEELNKDPHAVSSLEPGVQLATIQVNLSGNRAEAWHFDLGIASPKIQHFGGSWWIQHGGQYRIEARDHWERKWEVRYPREVKNIVDVIRLTEDVEEYHNTYHAARILKVYIFSRLTDMYGDIPYSEAGLGYTHQKFLPAYDKQEEIYEDFFKELDEAVAQLDASYPAIEGDLFYNGDIEKWKKFGNSLRMRLGFRVANVDPDNAEHQVEKAIENGVMQSNADICMMEHGDYGYSYEENRGNGRSHVFNASDNSEGYRLVSTLVDYMQETNDPRLTRYGGTYMNVEGGNYGTDVTEYHIEGIEPGAFWWNLWEDPIYITDEEGDTVINPNTGDFLRIGMENRHMMPSKYVAAYDAPFFHFTYAETELLMAEAVIRGWAAGDAETHFHNALEAACNHVSMYPGAPVITEGEIQDFIDANPFPADFDEQMKIIHEQMWVNFFLNGGEAYSNWRRTGYPELEPFDGVDDISPGAPEIPRRLFYPDFEIINNKENWQEAVDRMGGEDSWLNRVWWDVE